MSGEQRFHPFKKNTFKVRVAFSFFLLKSSGGGGGVVITMLAYTCVSLTLRGYPVSNISSPNLIHETNPTLFIFNLVLKQREGERQRAHLHSTRHLGGNLHFF